MIKKVDTSFGEGPRGQKPRISGDFSGSSLFSLSQSPPTPWNLQQRCIWVFYDIPPNFKAKYSQKILFVNKIKISTRWLSSYQSLFLAIAPQPIRLAG